MFRIAFVDDDPLTVAGLRQFIRWEAYDFVVVGEATDGVKGLSVLTRERPHVAIVDLRMPGLSGMDLVRKATELNLNTYFVLLTAYKDFEVARRAITLKVSDYLLKPIQRDQLLRVIQRLSSQLAAQVSTEESAHQERKLIRDIKSYMQRQSNSPLSLQTVADEFSINRYYLSHIFKQEAGRNFLSYLTQLRMRNAKLLLCNSNLTVDEIARETGFVDGHYLARVFKRLVGVTPTQWREGHCR